MGQDDIRSRAKPPSWRFVFAVVFVVAGVIGLCFLAPRAFRELGLRAAIGRDISLWHEVDSAVRIYHLERGIYPASLDVPDLQRYLGPRVVAFLREGRVDYHAPAADSPPTFILVRLTTPRGDYSTQLDGRPLYTKPRMP